MSDSLIPAELIYGPVQSVRFGRSLGVNCSPVGRVTCQWRCPYCQLGHLPWDRAGAYPDVDTILQELDQALEHCEADTLCICGSGEPSDHPEFGCIVEAVAQRAQQYNLRSVLLSNGDGCQRTDVLAAVAHLDAYYIKYDPGPQQGAWRAFGDFDRVAYVASLPNVGIQTLVYQGNDDAQQREQWLADMQTIGAQFLPYLTLIMKIHQFIH